MTQTKTTGIILTSEEKERYFQALCRAEVRLADDGNYTEAEAINELREKIAETIY